MRWSISVTERDNQAINNEASINVQSICANICVSVRLPLSICFAVYFTACCYASKMCVCSFMRECKVHKVYPLGSYLLNAFTKSFLSSPSSSSGFAQAFQSARAGRSSSCAIVVRPNCKLNLSPGRMTWTIFVPSGKSRRK